jgi:hypothetical protein
VIASAKVLDHRGDQAIDGELLRHDVNVTA